MKNEDVGGLEATAEKRMTIIIKALSFPKCEGFIRLNPNVLLSVGF